MAIQNLDDLFVHTLKDVLYAERRVLKALPKMERRAEDPKLKEAFAAHRGETEEQIGRLEQVFEMLGKPARGAKCDAILGLIEEAEDLMDEVSDARAMDAALASVAQAVEHYEIARYGTLVTWAAMLGHKDAAVLLKTTLEEERSADAKLTKIAESAVNKKAA
jgi:ferritin-like metal-binding protein YciE